MADIKFKEFKALLAKCLEDEEIRRMILQISIGHEQEPIDISTKEYKAEIKRLQENCDEYRKAAENANNELKEKAELADRQAKQLNDLTVQLEHRNAEVADLHREIERYKTEKEHFEADLEKLNGKLTVLERAYKEQIDKFASLEDLANMVKEKYRRLEGQLAQETAAKESLQSTLAECFGEGYALYQKYQQISPYTQKLLSGVFHRDDFESFIVGGCQIDALERIWDVLKSRIGDPELPVLWQIFVYFINLCNKSAKEDIYAVENVQIGDEYNYELHTIDQSSKAQGKITEVKLQGYKNIYKNKFIRKSIVHVE